MVNRLFLIVIDSLGIGGASDASLYGDEGSNTLLSLVNSPKLNIPNLKKLGLFNINGNSGGVKEPQGAYAPSERVRHRYL